MERLRKQLAFSVVITLAACGVCNPPAAAVELLVNGNLESSISPPGWTLTQTITDNPATMENESLLPVSATEQISFANQPMTIGGELGLLVKPTSGNSGVYAGDNHKTNVLLSQTFTGVNTSRFYTFTGHSFFGGDALPETASDGYSGGVTLLHSGSPSDPTPMDPDDPATVASPTVTTFKMEFLNASDVVLPSGTVTLDIRTDREAQSSPANDAMWRMHTVGGVNTVGQGKPPTGATKLRVTAAANDMITNFGFQSLYFDNFSLKDNVLTTTERLSNNNLNTVGPPNGYTITEGPLAGPGSTLPPEGQPGDIVRFIGFADHTHFLPGQSGAQGMWLAAFGNTTEYDPDVLTVDGSVSQTVPGAPGGDYTFSAWSAWENHYSGGLDPSVQTLMKMEFLDSSSMPIGMPLVLDLLRGPDGILPGQPGDTNDGQINDADDGPITEADWRQFSLNGTAPALTAFVRITAAGLGMFNTFPTGLPDTSQSAFFDDFSLIELLPGLPGDFNEDGKVDAADYVRWRKNETANNPLPNDNGLATQADRFNLWRANFGNMSGSGSGAGAAAMPEPATYLLASIGLLGVAGIRRRCD
ncbi:MAG: PEP-CTERM sorting domain-containing protein [Planctomycetes bacterium]|nr:PEP-CTERM sorting domain-containing protein [Planctomycetota bacterium]